ncbi:MAG TPA: hypothetical protein DDZ76_11990 [Xanthomonadales bacterium]|nr:hypothetical protein [Xanthomonadales bacterium]
MSVMAALWVGPIRGLGRLMVTGCNRLYMLRRSSGSPDNLSFPSIAAVQMRGACNRLQAGVERGCDGEHGLPANQAGRPLPRTSPVHGISAGPGIGTDRLHPIAPDRADGR